MTNIVEGARVIPDYKGFLMAVCSLLATQPARSAALNEFQGIVGNFSRECAELGGVRGLADEFPKHIQFTNATGCLKLIECPAAWIANISNAAVHQRRRTLQLLFACNGNIVGLLSQAVAKDFLKSYMPYTHFNILTATYPHIVAYQDSNIRLITLPRKLLSNEMLILLKRDAATKPALPEIPSTSKPAAVVAQPVAAVSKWYDSWGPAFQDPVLSNSRCDVFLVNSATIAVQVPKLIGVGKVAIDVEGQLTRKPGGIDCVQIAFQSQNTSLGNSSVVVFIWDFARASVQCRESMASALREILENPDRTIVVHDGRADTDALLHQMNIHVPFQMLDTQILFQHWVKASKALRSDTPNALASSYLADPSFDAHRRPGLNVVLAACKRPINHHKKTINFDGRGFWNEHGDPAILLEYAAFDVDQLVQAADFMLGNIRELVVLQVMQESHAKVEEFCKSHQSYFDPTQFQQINAADWNTSPLPKGGPLRAQFNNKGQLEWQFPIQRQDLQAEPLSGLEKHLSSRASNNTEVALLMARLPVRVCDALRAAPATLEECNEIVLDLGRSPQLYFFDRSSGAPRMEFLKRLGLVTQQDLADLCGPLTFASDNRAGIAGCLHRISRIVSISGDVIGATVRIGRACPPDMGVGQLLVDLFHEGNRSILIVGLPGSGKTHTIRDLCSRISLLGHRVMIVDTSNEIGGISDELHYSLALSRRMQVGDRSQQHLKLIEAVQNHTPDVLVVDEIGTSTEVSAIKSVETRIKSMIATVHGSFQSLLSNPVLRNLLGGLATVPIGDAMARSENKGRKLKTERAGPPTFTAAVEILGRGDVRVYHNVAKAVDDVMADKTLWAERRWTPDVMPSNLDLGAYNRAMLQSLGMGQGMFWTAMEAVPKADSVAMNSLHSDFGSS